MVTRLWLALLLFAAAAAVATVGCVRVSGGNQSLTPAAPPTATGIVAPDPTFGPTGLATPNPAVSAPEPTAAHVPTPTNSPLPRETPTRSQPDKHSIGRDESRWNNSAQMEPHWTADGTHIVFGDAGRIYAIDADGTNLVSLSGSFEPLDQRDLFSETVEIDVSPSPSPFGSLVAYATLRYTEADWGDHTYELIIQPIGGGGRQRLTDNDWNDVSPAWSPDGSRIAFVSERGDGPWVYTIAPDGSSELGVAPGVRVQTDAPVWSPDGSRLAFVAEVGKYYESVKYWDHPYASASVEKTSTYAHQIFREAIYLVDSDGSNLTKLAWADATDETPRTRESHGDLYETPEEDVTRFRWSPDGKRLAFAAHYYGEPDRLYVASADGSELSKVFDVATTAESGHYYTGRILDVAWTPDSSHVSFEVGRIRSFRRGYWHPWASVYAVSADGSSLRVEIDKDEVKYHLRWSQRVVGTGPRRIVRYTHSTGPNVDREVRGWILSTFGWGDSDERVLVRTAGNRLVAANPVQREASVDAGLCSDNRVVPNAESNIGLVIDCVVLLNIRDELAGDEVLYWTADVPIQEWPGITLGGSPPRVHSLESVPGVTLNGTIPPAISKLTELRVLRSEGDELSGSIPPELGRLGRLEVLNLGHWGATHNNFTGDIPPELGNLTNLKVLDLSYNKLDGAIPSELGYLSELEELDLWHNPLRGDIPRELGRLASLQMLHLGGNVSLLTGSVPPEIGDLTRLRDMRLTGPQLAGCLPSKFRQISELYVKLPFCPPQNTLDSRSVNTREARPVLSRDGPLLLEMRDRLAGEASLNWDFHTPMDKWEGIAVDSQSNSVVQLALADRGLTGSIPPELGQLRDLQYLDLSQNMLTGTIPPSLGQLQELQSIRLYGNLLSGEIPSQLKSLSKLHWINLAGNELTGDIPGSLGELTELRALSLAGNRLTGAIPPELGRLTLLEGLYLGGNDMKGELPQELASLSRLSVLQFHDMGLSGAIPSWLGQLSELTSIGLGNNNLTGPIPSSLGDLSKLERLRLSGNNLTGAIPPELGRITSLVGLYLSENNLTGGIPPELGHLTRACSHYVERRR